MTHESTISNRPSSSKRDPRALPAAPSSTTWPRKVDVMGVQVSVCDYDSAVKAIVSAAQQGEPGIVGCHAVHAIVTMASDPQLKQMANSFRMITPDGQPVRWAMNALHRAGLRQRVYGPELTMRLCQAAADEGLAIYLYGGNDEVSRKLVERLQQQFPGLQIAGAEAPPFRQLTAAEDQEVIDRINQSGAQLVFIGLGCPKQDLFAHAHRDTIQAVQICVGAAFDFHAGAKPMAPGWMQATGLEWLYRLIQEPRRLWKRYLVTNTQFVLGVSRQWVLGTKKPGPPVQGN